MCDTCRNEHIFSRATKSRRVHALEKDPERRYRKVSEVKTAVETIATTSGQIPPPIPEVAAETTRISSAWKMAPLIGCVALFLLMVLLGAAAWLFTRMHQPAGSAATSVARSINFETLLNDSQR